MENSMKGLIGVLIITGVVISPVAQKLSEGSKDLSAETLLGMLDTQTNLIKLATRADIDVKHTAVTLLEMGALPVYERALYPNSPTEDNLNSLLAFLESEGNDASFIQDVFPHCQKWLVFAEIGQTRFEVTPDIIEAYYESITQKRISSLRPAAKVSRAIDTKSGAVNAFCGSTCISTVECGECWGLREEFVEGQDREDLDAILAADTKIREKGCAIHCAQVCSSVFNSMSLIASTSYAGVSFGGESTIEDARTKIDFIDLGIGLP